MIIAILNYNSNYYIFMSDNVEKVKNFLDNPRSSVYARSFSYVGCIIIMVTIVHIVVETMAWLVMTHKH